MPLILYGRHVARDGVKLASLSLVNGQNSGRDRVRQTKVTGV
jgi:hypothetical protein